ETCLIVESTATFLISLTCICLASTDRFLASCRQEKYRKLSRLSLAIQAVILANIFWFGHSIPYLVYTELIRNTSTGSLSGMLGGNLAYAKHLIYFALPVYDGLLPSVYRNINKLQLIRQRQVVQNTVFTVAIDKSILYSICMSTFCIIVSVPILMARFDDSPSFSFCSLSIPDRALRRPYTVKYGPYTTVNRRIWPYYMAPYYDRKSPCRNTVKYDQKRT
ncbi:unnamed protein product, partial [Rotaria socialis]